MGGFLSGGICPGGGGGGGGGGGAFVRGAFVLFPYYTSDYGKINLSLPDVAYPIILI